MTEPIRTEREQLRQDYLDGHMSRGGIVSPEIERQAEAYADRIASNREYEAALRANADKQREQMAIAHNDAALRERSNRKGLANSWLNRFVGENGQITPAMREQADLYATRVLAQHDPAFEQRQLMQAQARVDAALRKREERMHALRQMLADEVGSDFWRDLRGKTQLLRQALDDLDAQLFREAMRPVPQGTPEGAGDAPDVSARQPSSTAARAARPRRHR